MAEGGEGEDEIQFLRTVSKENFLGADTQNQFPACTPVSHRQLTRSDGAGSSLINEIPRSERDHWRSFLLMQCEWLTLLSRMHD